MTSHDEGGFLWDLNLLFFLKLNDRNVLNLLHRRKIDYLILFLNGFVTFGTKLY